ncbi:hypothetical protein MMC14_008028 [Varicellaria rhodocarpa]|nr:hypothetical protein [Varicellaria rhodocarpa]
MDVPAIREELLRLKPELLNPIILTDKVEPPHHPERGWWSSCLGPSTLKTVKRKPRAKPVTRESTKPKGRRASRSTRTKKTAMRNIDEPSNLDTSKHVGRQINNSAASRAFRSTENKKIRERQS